MQELYFLTSLCDLTKMQNLADLVMPFAIALIMLGIGLELKFKDFRRVLLKPRAIITGLICQIILLPTIALILIYFWPIEPMYKIGIMLIAACPGGTTSNLVAKFLKGRVALSVSLTAFNSFLILFTIPAIMDLSFYLFLQENQQISLEFWVIMKKVLFTVVLPVLSGIIISESVSERIKRGLHKPLKIILPALLLIPFVVAIFFDKSNGDIQYFKHIDLLIPLFMLNGITMLAGFYLSKITGLNHRINYTVAIEMGLQNSVLALYIANQLLQHDELNLIAILYSSFSLVSTFLIAYVLKRIHYPKEEHIEE
ncbi:bile acid:sodium symporter family protein [Autumnicola musiva]|uniref:Bile acid:sodium symporter n=1 Tax=Autumnicola musiva TaxID=3075589 RepID=A0ABU3D901_9FLAO|nr:bile acid:sodium symporter [Zunongwangia sp. F117]MDT0678014.1 bile acid:sodium symporter [Zunongwangia sp. F117]